MRALSRAERQTGELLDRVGKPRLVFDLDGTREVARQRALPKHLEWPAAPRRLKKVSAPSYTGRKRGEVVRTRTTVLQAHSYQWLGSFGNRGHGLYREERRRAGAASGRSLQAHDLEPSRALLRLDGHYGTGATLCDLAGFSFVMRGKDAWTAGLRRGPGASASAPRSAVQPPGKSGGAHPLRLP